MQPMNSLAGARSDRAGRAWMLAATMLATTVAGGVSAAASAACPWVVQPYAQSLPPSSKTPTFDIVFDGMDSRSKAFYGFTVASLDLAWWLANQQSLPERLADARPLAAKSTPVGATAYQLSPETIQPHTVYLVAADSEIDALEAIDARIEPARPVAVSQLLPRTRGGTDWSGPLPHRSLPGFEISGTDGQASAANQDEVQLASVQICAYQVALR